MKKIICVLLLVVLGFAALWYTHEGQRTQSAFTPQHFSGQTLVIDAGHGGEDGGAVSVSSVSESVINLAVARRLDGIMGLFGVNTLMLRTEDASLGDPSLSTMRERKVSDLHNRVNSVNEADNPILISIHQNSFTDPRYSGAQVFYAPTEGSQFFAEYTQELLRVCLDPDNDRRAKPIPQSVYLMSHIDCKAILVECGFLTNPAEDQLLQSADYQLKLALTIAGAYFQVHQIET